MRLPRNIFWILIGIGVVIIILLMLIGNVISIGDKIAKVNNVLAIVFYVLCGLLIYLLIIHPILVIAFSPTFKVPTVLENVKKTRRIYIRVAKNLLRQKTLNENSITNLKNGLKNRQKVKIAGMVLLQVHKLNVSVPKAFGWNINANQKNGF